MKISPFWELKNEGQFHTKFRARARGRARARLKAQNLRQENLNLTHRLGFLPQLCRR